MQLHTGQCVEMRRGSLRYFDIPNPLIWNSVEDWIAYIPNIQFDLPLRPMPSHFNNEQLWMSQWFERSTLVFSEDSDGCWRLFPVHPANILILDGYSGMILPVYMCLENGVMYADGKYFSRFYETPFQILQMWRLENGTYYRIY